MAHRVSQCGSDVVVAYLRVHLFRHNMPHFLSGQLPPLLIVSTYDPSAHHFSVSRVWHSNNSSFVDPRMRRERVLDLDWE